jgi:hypothetical protein
VEAWGVWEPFDDLDGSSAEPLERRCERRKELENSLLVPAALDRAAERRVSDSARRTGSMAHYPGDASSFPTGFCDQKGHYVTGQYAEAEGASSALPHRTETDARIVEDVMNELADYQGALERRLMMMPGKDAFAAFRQHLQGLVGVSVTASAVIDAMRMDEIPTELCDLIGMIEKFSSHGPP